MSSVDIDILRRDFTAAFGASPRVFRSPGRINLIGEHTDYNEGHVMPAAIAPSVYMAVSARHDGRVRLRSTDRPEPFEASLTDLSPSATAWANYVLGVVEALRLRGCEVPGFDAFIASDLPVGAGLSSSAALCCATVFALDAVFGFGLPRSVMAAIARQAEHSHAGVMCGIMDPFASLFGRRGHFIRLDCRSLDHAYVPFRADGFRLLLLDTRVKHALASTAYNRRREECAQGLAWVRERHPEAASLRDVSEDMLDRCVAPRDPVVDRRCRFVVRENARLLALCDDLTRGDLVAAGRRLYETHAGLRDMYEVSCPEADFLVGQARLEPGVLGARMMGGGFGGCTLNLVRDEAAEPWLAQVALRYEAVYGRPPVVYAADLSDGTAECV
jgi:galactokinase